MFSSLSPIPSFPAYRGPHKVGSTELEIPISEVPSDSPVPNPQVTSIKFRAFYPTTSDADSRQQVHWLPSPQNQWKEAYASFVGASPRLARLLSYLPNLLSFVTIPAVGNAPLLPRDAPFPLVIFSHGLGGNANAYSAILGNLASCGIVCIAPEHRDGSCPISIVNSEELDSKSNAPYTIPYQRHAHSPNPEVLSARNAQLRIRLWELELVYTAITKINDGEVLKTLSKSGLSPTFTHALDLSPGNVTWAGHSFGAATVVQFIKSIFYHQSIPTPPEASSSPSSTTNNDKTNDWQPLYTPATNSTLHAQITPKSPLALLDLWAMPLHTEWTQWLWDKPLPCYTDPTPPPTGPNVISIMSTQFTNYPDILHRTKAALSPHPSATLAKLQAAEPTPPTSPERARKTEPLLFTAPATAHLSQSDFGPLFPWVTRRFLHVRDPLGTIDLNVRAVLQALMRRRGVEVGSVIEGGSGGGGDGDGMRREERGEEGEESKEKDEDEEEKKIVGWDDAILHGEGGLVRMALDI